MFTLLHSISFLPSAPAVAHSNRLQSFCVCEFSSKERQGRSGLSSDGRRAEERGGGGRRRGSGALTEERNTCADAVM